MPSRSSLPPLEAEKKSPGQSRGSPISCLFSSPISVLLPPVWSALNASPTSEVPLTPEEFFGKRRGPCSAQRVARDVIAYGRAEILQARCRERHERHARRGNLGLVGQCFKEDEIVPKDGRAHDRIPDRVRSPFSCCHVAPRPCARRRAALATLAEQRVRLHRTPLFHLYIHHHSPSAELLNDV